MDRSESAAVRAHHVLQNPAARVSDESDLAEKLDSPLPSVIENSSPTKMDSLPLRLTLNPEHSSEAEHIALKEARLSSLAKTARDQVAATREENRRLRAQIAAIRAKASQETMDKARKLLQTGESLSSKKVSLGLSEKVSNFFGPSSFAEKKETKIVEENVEKTSEKHLEQLGRAERRAMERQDIWSAQEESEKRFSSGISGSSKSTGFDQGKTAALKKLSGLVPAKSPKISAKLVEDIVDAGHKSAAAGHKAARKSKLDYEDDWYFWNSKK